MLIVQNQDAGNKFYVWLGCGYKFENEFNYYSPGVVSFKNCFRDVFKLELIMDKKSRDSSIPF